MKLQRCTFKRKKGSEWEQGIAEVISWDHDVMRILDAELNKVRGNVWSYELIPLSAYNRNVYIELPTV